MFFTINLISQRRVALVAVLLTGMAFLSLLFALDAPAADGIACANAPVGADPTPTVCISHVAVVFNGASPDNQFVVSWRTPKSESGQVKLASGETYPDVRGADYQGKTHYVVVDNLDARTTYTFDILSGDKTYTNNNAHWSVRVGPAIQPVNPYIVVGRVSNPDGSDADGAIVYAQVRDADDKGTQGRSAWLSGLIVVADGGNYFNINLEQARTTNNIQKYTFDPEHDRVYIFAVSPQGSASKAFPISDLHPPQAPPSLILNSNGAGSAVTATATLIPPTMTLTFTPTAIATATPVSPTPSPTSTDAPPSPTEVFTATPDATATLDVSDPTVIAVQETRLASEPQTTRAAEPAGNEIEPRRTRVYGGVPTVIPPQDNNGSATLVIFAIVLIVGAVLLGLAGFFITRTKS